MLTFNSLKITACTIALCASCLLASAQTREVEHNFSSFNSIFVDNDFSVSVERSRKDYSVTINVDTVLKDYVKAYVKNRRLYIELDQKTIPSDVKKRYKGKNSTPVMDVTVYAPEFINDITMSGASSLTINDEIECEEFTLTIKENANVKKLSVNAGTLTVTSSNKATANMELYADDLVLNTEGNSVIEVDTESEKVTVNAAGSSEVNLHGKSVSTTLNTSGVSKTVIDGQTVSLEINGGNMSNVDAINLRTANARVSLSQMCKVTEAATDTLTVNLSGSSTLIFDCEPIVKIESIKSSSMSRYSDAK